MQIFIDFHQGLRGPYGKGLVGHCTSGHSLNPPLRAIQLDSRVWLKYLPACSLLEMAATVPSLCCLLLLLQAACVEYQ